MVSDAIVIDTAVGAVPVTATVGPPLERLAVVVVDGSAVAVVAAEDSFGVNGASAGGMTTYVGVGCADGDADAGFGGVGQGEECCSSDSDGC